MDRTFVIFLFIVLLLVLGFGIFSYYEYNESLIECMQSNISRGSC